MIWRQGSTVHSNDRSEASGLLLEVFSNRFVCLRFPLESAVIANTGVIWERDQAVNIAAFKFASVQ